MAHTFALIPASYVFLLRDGEVLLQRRRNTGYMDGFWVAGAAGHVEPGETARQAAVREAAEELGVTIDPAELTLVTVLQRTDGTDAPREQRVEWFWTTTAWSGDAAIQEPHKASDLRWWPLDALPEQSRLRASGAGRAVCRAVAVGLLVRFRRDGGQAAHRRRIAGVPRLVAWSHSPRGTVPATTSSSSPTPMASWT